MRRLVPALRAPVNSQCREIGAWGLRVVAAVALIKILWGGAGLLWIPNSLRSPTVPLGVYLAHLGVFAGCGALLWVRSTSDPRAASLGTFFLLVASTFADRGLGYLTSTGSTGAGILYRCQLEAAGPAVLWAFVADFPRVQGFRDRTRLLRIALVASILAGLGLFIFNALAPLDTLLGDRPPPPARNPLYRHHAGTTYWLTLLLLQLGAVLFALARMKQARIEERRRVRLLLLGLGLSLLPLTSILTARTIFPSFGAWSRSGPGIRTLGWLVYPSMLSIPLLTTYAVVVDKALDIGLVIRLAVRYAIARGALLVAAAVPALGLTLLVYANRDAPVRSLVTGSTAIFLTLVFVGALLVIGFRGPLLTALDRAFFRERYDAQAVMRDVTRQCSSAQDKATLGFLLTRALDDAMHLQSCSALFLSPEDEAFLTAAGDARALPANAGLCQALRQARSPLEVAWDRESSWQFGLPSSERTWLMDCGAQFVFPVPTSGDLLGVLVVGDKRSELPLSFEDRELIEALTEAAGLALRGWSVADSTRITSPPESITSLASASFECTSCGRLSAHKKCPDCGSSMEEAFLPMRFKGRYLLERRIGRGGGGVVYRAFDRELARPVAVKTLPKYAESRAAELRREARALAAVAHPNLASIYDFHSWNGVPVLVLEYLDGGMLRDRIREAPYHWRDGFQMARGIALGLGALHQDGMLHRDVKPSNIGYSRSVPKLVDFGIAGWALGGAEDEPSPAGTVGYLPPETWAGVGPGPRVDLWGLAVTTYEVIAGTNPFHAGRPDVAAARAAAGAPDIRSFRPDVPAAVAERLGAALNPSPDLRPASVDQFIRHILDVDA